MGDQEFLWFLSSQAASSHHVLLFITHIIEYHNNKINTAETEISRNFCSKHYSSFSKTEAYVTHKNWCFNKTAGCVILQVANQALSC